ncbi:MAG: PDZ domain-containing protein [Candidatus Eisenbacteria bacterium]|nr:PDZ domain-containing protein [Candidatus Eisenbacteria bacterium]
MRHALQNTGIILAALAVLAAPAATASTPSPTPEKGAAAPRDASGATSAKPWLGVYTQNLTDELREGLGATTEGVLVSQVLTGSPAEKAGLKAGDVIVTFAGKAMRSPDDLQDAVRAAKSGDRADLEISRDGKPMKISATLAGRPDDFGSTTYGDARGMVVRPDMNLQFENLPGFAGLAGLGRGRLGVRLQDLDPDLGGYFSAPDGKGALILEVEKDSPASRAGLRPGDVIVRIGERDVYDSEDVAKAIRSAEGRVALTVLRKGQRQSIAAELARAPQAIRIVRGRDLAGLDDEIPDSVRGFVGHTHHTMPLQREMEQLRDEIRELREQLKEKPRN